MSLTKKLLIKPNMQIAVLNAPPGYTLPLGELPPGARILSDLAPGSADAVILMVNSLSELDALAPQAIAAVKYDGLLWITYPKKSSKIKTDIDRDTGWERMKRLGMAGVAQIAVDEIWSAMRYRPEDRVGK